LQADAWRRPPQPPSISELYHENTKGRRHRRARAAYIEALNASRQHHERAERGSKVYHGAPFVALPDPGLESCHGFEEILRRRRSAREFSLASVGLEEVAYILRSGMGSTGQVAETPQFPARRLRAAPSGGALYPLECYLVARHVADLRPGVYHFQSGDERLALLCEAPSAAIWNAVPHSGSSTMAALLVLAAVLPRTKIKYGEFGYRLALLEAGHIAQNLLLGAAALDLAACPIGGFVDDEVHDALALDGVNEVVFYLVGIGRAPA
jgi:SagB-type dehydrogenase family enzyme